MKVFVSSTTSGLGVYRDHLIKCLKGFQIGVEDQASLGTDWKTLDDLLRHTISSCDAVLCLIGPVFGAMIPKDGDHAAPESFTQLEYRWARKTGRDIFIFRPTEDCEGLQNLKQEDAEFQISQKNFIKEVEAEYKDKWYSFQKESDLGSQISEVIALLTNKTLLNYRYLPTPMAVISSRLSKTSAIELEKDTARLFLSLATLVEYFPTWCSAHRLKGETAIHARDVLVWASKICGETDLVSSNCFVSELAEWFIEQRDNLKRRLKKLTEFPDYSELGDDANLEAAKQLKELMLEMLKSFAFFERYLLVKVELSEGQKKLRVFRNLEANDLRSCEFDTGVDFRKNDNGSVFLLSFAKRQALCLSANLIPYAETTFVVDNNLCADVRYAGVTDVIPVCPGKPWRSPSIIEKRPAERAWIGQLLTVKCWETLRGLYAPFEEELWSGKFKIIGAPYHQGYLFSTYPAVKIPEAPQKIIVVQKPNKAFPESVKKEQVETRLREKWTLWSKLADQIPDVVLHPLADSDCSLGTNCPFIALPYYSNAVPLNQIRLEEQQIIDVMRLAFKVCTKADQLNIRLLTLLPRHILRLQDGSYCFLGFDTIASGGAPLSSNRDSTKIYRREDWAELAPELQTLELCPSTNSDVFALGALYQKLRGQSPSPQPSVKTESEMLAHMWQEWRKDPIACFVFHCLAQDANRRFQSIQQCEYFFERYVVGFASTSTVDAPEQIPLSDKLSISRFPVTNYQYGQFEGKSVNVRRQYMPVRFTGPFLPAVNVNERDALQYCNWLNCYAQNKGEWRLPTEQEWEMAAAGNGLNDMFPWGLDSPTAQHANYDALYFGTTVVGACPRGASAAGCEDMAGNVREWCSDLPQGEKGQRIVKGGSYRSSPDMLGIKTRQNRLFGGRFEDVGFRVIHEKK